MCRHLFFFMVFSSVVKVFASDSDLLGSYDEPLFPDSTQALLPLESGSLDLTDLTTNLNPSAFDGDSPLFAATSIPPSEETIDFSPDEFSNASDLFAVADCSTSDSSIFPTIGKSRTKRLAQCGAPDKGVVSPSIPTVDDMDAKLRETIMRIYPTINDELRLSQEDDDDNSACVLLSAGVMPHGACTSLTTDDWSYISSGAFSWNSNYQVTLWDLYNIIPGMTKTTNNFSPPDPCNLS